MKKRKTAVCLAMLMAANALFSLWTVRVQAAEDNVASAMDEEVTLSEADDVCGDGKNTLEEKNSAVYTSRKILVCTENADMIRGSDEILDNWEDVYLLQFASENETAEAYAYYSGNSDFVSADAEVVAAGEADNTGNYASKENNDAISTGTEALSALASALEETSAEEMPRDSARPLIAVIDTGMPEKNPHVIQSVSMTGEETADDNGHGTRTLQYITEENPEVQVISVKALRADGTGDMSSVYAGITYAVAQKPDILLLPLYAFCREEHDAVQSAIREAVSSGIMVVGAAGNDNRDVRYYVPGSISEAFIIGACSETGMKISSSNFGETVDYYMQAGCTSEAAARFAGILSTCTGSSAEAFLQKRTGEESRLWDAASVQTQTPDNSSQPDKKEMEPGISGTSDLPTPDETSAGMDIGGTDINPGTSDDPDTPDEIQTPDETPDEKETSEVPDDHTQDEREMDEVPDDITPDEKEMSEVPDGNTPDIMSWIQNGTDTSNRIIDNRYIAADNASLTVKLGIGGKVHLTVGGNTETIWKQTDSNVIGSVNDSLRIQYIDREGSDVKQYPVGTQITVSLTPDSGHTAELYQIDDNGVYTKHTAPYTFHIERPVRLYAKFDGDIRIDTKSLQKGNILHADDRYANDEPAFRTLSSEEKIWGRDPFDEAYAAGYLVIHDSHAGPGCVQNGRDVTGTNHERKEDCYVDHYEGACINGEYYDIREYVWMDGYTGWSDKDQWRISAYNGSCISDDYWKHVPRNEDYAQNKIIRELHFYRAGTLKDSKNLKENEVTFRGILCLRDLDGFYATEGKKVVGYDASRCEGYTIQQGFVNVWLNQVTHILKMDGGRTLVGTWTNGDYNSGFRSDNIYTPERETAWVEVEGTPSRPLTLQYHACGGCSSSLNYYGSHVNYALVTDVSHLKLDPHAVVENPPGLDLPHDIHCATYAGYTVKMAGTYEPYVFSGWYMDPQLTQKADNALMVRNDITLYGLYTVNKYKILTSCTPSDGGSIDASMEQILTGSDRNIRYHASHGWYLDRIIVDGNEISADRYPSSYAFHDIKEDHTIDVHFSPFEKEHGLTLTKKVTHDKAETSIDGKVVERGTQLKYTLYYSNTSGRRENLKITDAIPSETAFISADHQGICTDGKTICWDLGTIEPGASGSVSFLVRVGTNPAAVSITNQGKAEVIITGADGSFSVDSNQVVNYTISAVKTVEDGRGEDINGHPMTLGHPVTYKVSVKNTTGSAKEFTLRDSLPKGLQYRNSTGTYQDGTVIWKKMLQPGDTLEGNVTVIPTSPGLYDNICEAESDDATAVSNKVSNPVYRVQVLKTDAGGNTPLQGAGFILQNDKDMYYLSQNDTVSWVGREKAGTVKTDKMGSAVFSGMEPGTYTLEETEAPEGYTLHEQKKTIQIEPGQYDQTITLTDSRLPDLPNSGGTGTGLFLLTAAVLGIVGVIMARRGKR